MLRVLVSSRNTSSSGGGGSRRNHARRIFGGAGTTPFHHMNGGPQQQTLRHVVLLRRYISSSDGSSSIRRRNGIVERIDRIPYHFRHLSTKYYSCTSTVKKTSSSNGAEGILRWDSFQQTHGTKLESLPEVIAMNRLDTFLHDKVLQEQNRRQQQQRQQPHDPPPAPTKNYKYTMNTNQIQLCLDSSIMTFLLHVYARQASLIGHGYYTIGPCGEELLSSVALALHSNDSLALHYRHLAVSISRQLLKQDATSDDSNNENTPTTTYDEQTVKDILLARARGYTISKYDPVTGGVHCALGGGRNDYIVTSTLASQCPPAVGRALAYSLNTNNRNPNQRPISMCTVGDGSVHNGHFWSAWTLAKHAKHMNIKCPLVMGISDNGLSISYQTKGFVHELFPNNNNNNSNNINSGIPIFRANGQDMMDVYDQTTQATNFARKYSSPTLLLFSNMIRRFGHAATDRQISYLDQATIDSLADTDVLQSTMIQAIEVYNVYEGEGGYVKLRDRYHQLQEWTKEAFEIAMNEPKVTLDDMMERVTMPLIPLPSTSISSSSRSNTTTDYEHVTTMNTVTNSSLMVRDVEDEKTSNDATVAQDEKPQVLRKQMTRVLDEIMSNDPSVVYLGEDVIHGGYYLVTEGLATKFNKDVRRRRIFDFPPDETSLLGAGLGFRQVGGVVPIVELPYAKYLDCGVDMFYEIAILNWLSNRNNKLLQQSSDDENSSSTIQPHGMVIRLQGKNFLDSVSCASRVVGLGTPPSNLALHHFPQCVGCFCRFLSLSLSLSLSNLFSVINSLLHRI